MLPICNLSHMVTVIDIANSSFEPLLDDDVE